MNYSRAALKTTLPLPSLDWMLKFFTHIKKILAVVVCLALLWALCFSIGLTSPLHFPVKTGLTPAVRLLSKAGLTNDAEFIGLYRNCYTPLEIALGKGNITIVDILLDDGADLLGACKGRIEGAMRPRPPNVLAGSVMHPALLEHLIKERHISPDIGKDKGVPPIFSVLWCRPQSQRPDTLSAEEEPHIKSLHILVENGATVNVARRDGQGPLSTAIINGCTDIALYLLNHGADFKAAKEAVETHLVKVGGNYRDPQHFSGTGEIRTILRVVEEAAAAKKQDSPPR